MLPELQRVLNTTVLATEDRQITLLDLRAASAQVTGAFAEELELHCEALERARVHYGNDG
ncbi:hypothetical protein [Saccharopolyspora hattusasensis]|uniref:hypothetical protein n=1 Tax=Saccharopolyspora hattusasensis TaxID=1128679 RepID=UPI003D96B27D